MMQKAVCALSGVVILCLAAIVCLFVVMHHNANIVSSHHDDPLNMPTEQPRSNVVSLCFINFHVTSINKLSLFSIVMSR